MSVLTTIHGSYIGVYNRATCRAVYKYICLDSAPRDYDSLRVRWGPVIHFQKHSIGILRYLHFWEAIYLFSIWQILESSPTLPLLHSPVKSFHLWTCWLLISALLSGLSPFSSVTTCSVSQCGAVQRQLVRRTHTWTLPWRLELASSDSETLRSKENMNACIFTRESKQAKQ